MKNTVVTLLVIGLLGACGRTDNQAPGGDLTELQKVPPSHATSLISAFGMAPSNAVGAFVAFYSNKRYFAGVVQKLNPQWYRIAGAIGYYEESGSVITTTGKKTTCQKLTSKFKGKSRVVGPTSANTIVVTTGTTSAVLNRVDLSRASLPQEGLLIEWGCFDSTTGAFTSESWSDIR